MQKILYILWPKNNLSVKNRREILLNDCAIKILELGCKKLTMNIDDEYSTVKSPAPKFYNDDDMIANVSVYFAPENDHSQHIKDVQSLLEDAGFKVGCYFVDESIYKDYGDNIHFKKRDWPDGQRSPTVLAATLLTKPKKFSHEEWIKRWHGKMSPISERLQPRARYVRNVITSKTDHSPAFDGFVEEAWPSAKHISNAYLFYNANNIWQLLSHMLQMIRVVTQFHQLHKIRTVTMSEYFIKS